MSYFCFKNKPIFNPLGQNFPQRELKSMSEIVYTNIMEIKQLQLLVSVSFETLFCSFVLYFLVALRQLFIFRLQKVIISIFLETFCRFSHLCHGAVLSARKRVERRYSFTQLTPQAYTVFTNGGHAGKNWCLVMKARRWRVNKICK